MIRIDGINSPVDIEQDLLKIASKYLRCSQENIREVSVAKRSIDARKKPLVNYVYTLDVDVKDLSEIKNRHSYTKTPSNKYSFEPKIKPGEKRPVIAGSGPAGLFCALLLSYGGFAPILVERGDSVEERDKKVNRFAATGILDPESNVQFGEGGAGTFSDGKLTSRSKDKEGRNRFVLETFASFGADPDILFEQYPHIGTDVLKNVVRNMRERFCSEPGLRISR